MTLKYCDNNPIIKPSNIDPLLEDFKILGTFNAAVEIYNNKYYMLLRVAERFLEKDKKVLVPIIYEKQISKLEFDLHDENYDFSDLRVVVGKSSRFLTSMSRILIMESEDGIHFKSTGRSILADNEYEKFGIEDPRITKIDDIYNHEDMKIHYDWYEEIKSRNKNITTDNVDEIVKDEVGIVFTKVLEHCGVFKWDNKGKEAIKRYIDNLKESIK